MDYIAGREPCQEDFGSTKFGVEIQGGQALGIFIIALWKSRRSLQEVGDEPAENGPIDRRDVGIAGDDAGTAPAADEAIIEKAHNPANHCPDEYDDHLTTYRTSRG